MVLVDGDSLEVKQVGWLLAGTAFPDGNGRWADPGSGGTLPPVHPLCTACRRSL